VVEVGEPFGAREFRFVNQPDPPPGVTFVAFGGQRLGQERLVGEALLSGRRSQRAGLGADSGQLQGFCREVSDLLCKQWLPM
jgi:hypothetical protein